jgi:hypothetical protein
MVYVSGLHYGLKEVILAIAAGGDDEVVEFLSGHRRLEDQAWPPAQAGEQFHLCARRRAIEVMAELHSAGRAGSYVPSSSKSGQVVIG